MVACRSRGAAPTRCQATASAIAALGPLADVAVDGGRQTLPSLTPNLCLSRLIQESSGFWYRFQLLRLHWVLIYCLSGGMKYNKKILTLPGVLLIMRYMTDMSSSCTAYLPARF